MAVQENVRRFRDLDGIRGILAVIIVLDHFGLKSMLERISGGLIVSPAFPVIVDFFFVLSGFVLAKSYLRRPRPLGEALIERVFRLLPCPAFLLLVLLAIRASVTMFGSDPATLRPLDAAPLVAEFFALYIFLFDGYPGWNPPSWSVNVQIYVTVLLGLGVAVLWRMPRMGMFVMFGLLVMAQGCLSYVVTVEEYFPVLRGFIGVGLGALLAGLIERRFITIPATRLFLPLSFAAFGMLILVRDLAPIIAIFTPVLISFIMSAGTRSSSVLSLPPLLALGDLSYSIYIVHLPVWTLVHWFADLEGPLGSLAFKPVWLLVVVLSAWLLNKFVEEPGVRFGRAVLDRKRRAAAEPRSLHRATHPY
jgi:peptidoglycan/LPS O-acetylase OafA/YrhL